MTTTFKYRMPKGIAILDAVVFVWYVGFGLFFGKSLFWSLLFAGSVTLVSWVLILSMTPVANYLIRKWDKK